MCYLEVKSGVPESSVLRGNVNKNRDLLTGAARYSTAYFAIRANLLQWWQKTANEASGTRCHVVKMSRSLGRKEAGGRRMRMHGDHVWTLHGRCGRYPCRHYHNHFTSTHHLRIDGACGDHHTRDALRAHRYAAAFD